MMLFKIVAVSKKGSRVSLFGNRKSTSSVGKSESWKPDTSQKRAIEALYKSIPQTYELLGEFRVQLAEGRMASSSTAHEVAKSFNLDRSKSKEENYFDYLSDVFNKFVSAHFRGREEDALIHIREIVQTIKPMNLKGISKTHKAQARQAESLRRHNVDIVLGHMLYLRDERGITMRLQAEQLKQMQAQHATGKSGLAHLEVEKAGEVDAKALATAQEASGITREDVVAIMKDEAIRKITLNSHDVSTTYVIRAAVKGINRSGITLWTKRSLDHIPSKATQLWPGIQTHQTAGTAAGLKAMFEDTYTIHKPNAGQRNNWLFVMAALQVFRTSEALSQKFKKGVGPTTTHQFAEDVTEELATNYVVALVSQHVTTVLGKSETLVDDVKKVVRELNRLTDTALRRKLLSTLLGYYKVEASEEAKTAVEAAIGHAQSAEADSSDDSDGDWDWSDSEDGSVEGVALHDFAVENEGDLAIKQGDKITIIGGNEDGWTLVRNASGDEGVVPTSYIQEGVAEAAAGDDPAPVAAITATALYSYEVDDEDAVSLTEGEKITIIEKDDKGWTKIQKANGSTGWVPTNYIKENTEESAGEGEADPTGTDGTNAAGETDFPPAPVVPTHVVTQAYTADADKDGTVFSVGETDQIRISEETSPTGGYTYVYVVTGDSAGQSNWVPNTHIKPISKKAPVAAKPAVAKKPAVAAKPKVAPKYIVGAQFKPANGPDDVWTITEVPKEKGGKYQVRTQGGDYIRVEKKAFGSPVSK